jgi:endonuclease/exonuclease/phosphatase family metal-dependent hydrolase
LQCLTDEDFVKSGKLANRHSIDHIAISDTALTNPSHDIEAWESDAGGAQLSDHNGVAVTLRHPSDSVAAHG